MPPPTKHCHGSLTHSPPKTEPPTRRPRNKKNKCYCYNNLLCIIIYCYSHLLYIIIMAITKVPKYIYELYFLSPSLYQNTNSMKVGEGGVLYPKCLKQFVTHSRQLLNTCWMTNYILLANFYSYSEIAQRLGPRIRGTLVKKNQELAPAHHPPQDSKDIKQTGETPDKPTTRMQPPFHSLWKLSLLTACFSHN